MFFTVEDYKKIQQWLQHNAIKDTEFHLKTSVIPDIDILTIVSNGINYKIKAKDFLNSGLAQTIIDNIIANSVKIEGLLTVDASKVILDENLTLNDVLSELQEASTGWKVEYIIPQQDEPTVRAKYVLRDYKGVPKGDVIKVYKDSAITNVYLGTTDDTCDEDTGVVTKHPIKDNNEALSIVYRLDTGKYSLVNIPISMFTMEAEFDKYRGLGITENGQVFIKLAEDTESSNYLHFNELGEIAADGIEARILKDLGSIITSVAGDGTMWGQYKEQEGTQETSVIDDGSRWGEFKKAEELRDTKVDTEISKIQTKVDEVNLATIKKAQDEAIKSIETKEEEILSKSDASQVSYIDNQSIGTTNVQDAVDKVYELTRPLQELGDSTQFPMSQKAVTAQQMNGLFVGKGDTFSRNRYTYFMRNRTYQIIFDNPNWSIEDVAITDVYLFSVGINGNDIITVPIRSSAEKSYIFSTPDEDIEYVTIGGRAAVGETVRFTVIDISANSHSILKLAKGILSIDTEALEISIKEGSKGIISRRTVNISDSLKCKIFTEGDPTSDNIIVYNDKKNTLEARPYYGFKLHSSESIVCRIITTYGSDETKKFTKVSWSESPIDIIYSNRTEVFNMPTTLVQSDGDSDSVIMSQKAVCELVSKKHTLVSHNVGYLYDSGAVNAGITLFTKDDVYVGCKVYFSYESKGQIIQAIYSDGTKVTLGHSIGELHTESGVYEIKEGFEYALVVYGSITINYLYTEFTNKILNDKVALIDNEQEAQKLKYVTDDKEIVICPSRVGQGTLYKGVISSSNTCLYAYEYFSVTKNQYIEVTNKDNVSIRISEYDEEFGYIRQTDYSKNIGIFQLSENTCYIRVSANYDGYNSSNPITKAVYSEGDFSIRYYSFLKSEDFERKAHYISKNYELSSLTDNYDVSTESGKVVYIYVSSSVTAYLRDADKKTIEQLTFLKGINRIEIPINCKYIGFYLYNTSTAYIFESYIIKGTLRDALIRVGEDDNNNKLAFTISSLATGYGHLYKNAVLPTFALTTDIHGDWKRFERAVCFADSCSSIKGSICLGDIGDTPTEFKNYDYSKTILEASKPMLTIPGNHEFYYSKGFTDEEIHEKLYSDDLVTHNEETHPEGKNYWYKDITSTINSVKYKLRIIGLYEYECKVQLQDDGNYPNSEDSWAKARVAFSQEQLDWLINLLDDCDENTHVMILTHYAPCPCNTNDHIWNHSSASTSPITRMTDAYILPKLLDAWVKGTEVTIDCEMNISFDTSLNEKIDINHTFTSHEGKFAGFIFGHIHRDFIGYADEYPDLKTVGLLMTSAAEIQNGSDTPKCLYDSSQDSFTLISYDFFKNQIRLARIGANYSVRGFEKKIAIV